MFIGREQRERGGKRYIDTGFKMKVGIYLNP